MSFFSALSSALPIMTGGLSTALTSAFGSSGQKAADLLGLSTPEQKLAREQYDWQRSVDERNYQHTREQWQNELAMQQYQRDLQERMFQREDSGIQRRVADLKAAGINPVLAAGQAAPAGTSVAMSPAHAPHYQNLADKNIEGEIIQRARERQLATIHGIMNILQQSSQISHTRADIDRIRTEIDLMQPEHLRRQRETDIHAIQAAASQMQAETAAANVRLSARKWDEAERILTNARTGNLNASTASERLRALGIPYDTSRKAIEAAQAGHDLRQSSIFGLRSQDSMDKPQKYAAQGTRIMQEVYGNQHTKLENLVDQQLRNILQKTTGQSMQIPSHINENIRRYKRSSTRSYR